MSQFFARLVQSASAFARSKHLVRVVGVLLVIGLFTAIPLAANAGFFDPIYRFASAILFWAANVLGKLTLLLFGVLVQVAQYNDFINADAVTIGWRILRDLANMLFILVLLVIAFGTAFRIQQYRYNSLLRQLIIMAVLINFSKLITGFFIDLVQVIMMTFVNAFADTAAGNLTTALGLDKVLMLNTSIPGDEITDLSVAGTLAIGVVMIAVLYVIIFLARIIFLWILIILSPLAYLFATFPSTRKYWSDWWRQFWQYAVVGPVLAFFLWLTLTVTAAGNAALQLDPNRNLSNQSTLTSGGDVTAAISAIGSQSGILSFLVAIMLLIFSLKTATTFSVAGAGWAVNNFNKARDTALGGAKRLTGGIAGGLYGATLQRPAEALAQRATGVMSRIPLVSGIGTRLNSRLGAYQKKRKEEHERVLGTASDMVLAGKANSIPWLPTGWSPGAKAQREMAQKLHPGSIRSEAKRNEVLSKMAPADFRGVSKTRLKSILAGLKDEHITNAYPDFARAIIQGGTKEQKRMLGLDGVEWLAPTRSRPAVYNAEGKLVKKAVESRPGKFVAYDKDGKETVLPEPAKEFADIDRAKYEATRDAIDMKHGGDAEAFYKDPRYLANQAQYLGKEDFLETQALQRERERKLERGESRIEELTGIKSATQRGRRGESANLAMDFAEGEMLGLALGNAAGANLTGAEQKVAAGVLSEKYKSQQEEKEIDKRQQAMQEEADEEYQREREEAALRGELGSVERREISREDAAAAVKSDATFQQALMQESAEFRSSLENAKSINLVNKGRVGRGARQVLRHEQAHNAVSEMDEKELDSFWKQLAPERQKEIESYIRENWAGGAEMDMRQIQEEFFTEVFASHGRSKRFGPLGLNMEDPEKYQETRRVIDEEFEGRADAFYRSTKYRDNTMDYVQRDNMQRAIAEEELAERLSGASTLNKQEKARASVQTLAPEGLRSMWETLSPDRRRELEEYISEDSDQLRFLKRGKNRSRYEETQRMISERYGGNTRAFFDSNEFRNNKANFLSEKDYRRADQELIGAQKEAFGSMLASFNGAETDGPLNFQKDEQELSLLLRAATENKKPMTAPSVRPPAAAGSAAPKRRAAATSATEFGARAPKPPTVAAPSGSSRVTAAAPARTTRAVEAPISPVVQTTVINNTTVQNTAADFSRKLEGRLGMLPSRGDLLGSLQQLQRVVLDVAKEQGIADKELHGLSAEIERLKTEVSRPSQLPKDQEALHTNLRTFMARFKKVEKKEAESDEPPVDIAA